MNLLLLSVFFLSSLNHLLVHSAKFLKKESIALTDGSSKDENQINDVDIKEMIDEFQLGKKMNLDELNNLLEKAAALLENEKNIVSVQVPSDGRLVIIGDLHGQFNDLCNILKYFGIFPNDKLYFLFNGDFVDRGENGFEVLIVILKLKIQFPKYVFLNRGNHEEAIQCEIYGFFKEMIKKYNEEVFKKITEEVFTVLPIAHKINNEIFVVHGGISRNEELDLDDYNIKYDRKCFAQTNEALKQPYQLGTYDSLWSDPGNDASIKFQPGPRGGNHMVFNSVATMNFLAKNKFSLLIRSHEASDGGHFLVHNDRCLTIHSCPNYYSEIKNDGSFAVFTPGRQTIEIFQFKSKFNNRSKYKYNANAALKRHCLPCNIKQQNEYLKGSAIICKCPIRLARIIPVKKIDVQNQ